MRDSHYRSFVSNDKETLLSWAPLLWLCFKTTGSLQWCIMGFGVLYCRAPNTSGGVYVHTELVYISYFHLDTMGCPFLSGTVFLCEFSALSEEYNPMKHCKLHNQIKNDRKIYNNHLKLLIVSIENIYIFYLYIYTHTHTYTYFFLLGFRFEKKTLLKWKPSTTKPNRGTHNITNFI